MNEKKTLLGLADNYMEFVERLVDGADTDEALDALIAEFDEQAKEPFQTKCESYARIDKVFGADEKALEALIEPLTLRLKSIQRSRKGLRRRLGMAFEMLGIEKLKTLVATIYTMRTQSVVVDDLRVLDTALVRARASSDDSSVDLPSSVVGGMLRLLPVDFSGDRVELSADKKAIKDALKTAPVEGAHLQESKSVVIR